MSEPIKVPCDLKVITCQCGTFYGVPYWVNSYLCPMCAERRMSEIVAERDAAEDEVSAKDRTINSLRGVITKLKRRK